MLIANKHIGLRDNNLVCSLLGMTLAERLRHARKEYAGLTQKELEEKSKVSQQTISNIETGIQIESTDIVMLARACGVSPDWLYDETGPMVIAPNREIDHRAAHVLEVMEKSPDYVVDAIAREADSLVEFAKRAKANGETGTHG